MNMKILLLAIASFLFCCCSSCSKEEGTEAPNTPSGKVELPDGKAIFIPQDLQGMDLQNPNSKWSYHRMACTDNFVILWEKGFGNDLSNPPLLEGQSMKIDLENLKQKLEQFYTYYYETLQFARKGSNCDKYRMMVMLNYSLEGTAYGGDYDGVIGALWVTPSRLQDSKLNCIAHELGHSFQAQISCDKQGDAWGGCGFFEMTSQWMLWHVNPAWVTDEQYHWDAFCKATHKAYLHLENIYRSPYVIEYWSEKHGLPFIAELYRQGKVGEDPAMTYKRLNGLTQEQFCDEMFEADSRIVTLDFDHARTQTRPLAGGEAMHTTLADADSEGWQKVPAACCPENYGFNVIPLKVPQDGKARVAFRGLPGEPGYTALRTDQAGWRYGFVAMDRAGKTHYSPMGKEKEGTLDYTLPADTQKLWFVVMGAPAEHWRNDDQGGADAQWPYQIKIG